MKRSEINNRIEETIQWLESRYVKLPPFAYFTLDDWKTKGEEYAEIWENMLGWDMTDYGHDRFDEIGLMLFTIRNGNLKKEEYAKPYAEKLLISQVGQVTPNHFHWYKMEDIINRGGGNLVVQLWNSLKDESLDEVNQIEVRVDGCRQVVNAGGKVILRPGESITLNKGQYHSFWAEGERVMGWEVSMMNDDNTDNRFYEKQSRFSDIEEDEPPKYLLCNEYKRFLSL